MSPEQSTQPAPGNSHGGDPIESVASQTAAKLSMRELLGLMPQIFIALAELTRARIQFGLLDAADIPLRNTAFAKFSASEPDQSARQVKARRNIALVVPRVAKRMPFRSDCLVQAIAAQNWLGRCGLSSEIVIGVRKPADEGFGAHAWLRSRGGIITGGEIEKYTVLLESEES